MYNVINIDLEKSVPVYERGLIDSAKSYAEK